jgi:predicted Fe-Mo cluster-binding NifX family protein
LNPARRTKVKLVLTTSGETLDAPLESRFGRAPKFLVYDTESNTFEVIDNEQNVSAVQGAGIQAAETVARSGAACIVTGHCGPRAYRVLSAAGVKVYNTDIPTVAAALDAFKAGRLKPAASADMKGQWV